MTIQTKQIHGKIAKILNDREVIMNVGGNQGVEHGMLFDIMTPRGYDVTDPDTGEVLGSVERPKTRVKVIQVYDKLSVATTFRKKSVNVGGTAPLLLRRMFDPPRWVTRYETLETRESTWEDLDEEDSYVSTGDPVVQVFDDEDAL